MTTARVTHATPAAMYAKTANRDWEADVQVPEDGGCEDIASQLVGNEKIKLVLGGGRRNFRSRENGALREDRDLVEG